MTPQTVQLFQQVVLCCLDSNRSGNVSITPQTACEVLFGDLAFRNVVVIVHLWPQCWEMNRGLLGSLAGNKVMSVSTFNFRAYVTCLCHQIDQFICRRRETGLFIF